MIVTIKWVKSSKKIFTRHLVEDHDSKDILTKSDLESVGFFTNTTETSFAFFLNFPTLFPA